MTPTTHTRRTFGTKNLKAPPGASIQAGKAATKARKGVAFPVTTMQLATGAGLFLFLGAIFLVLIAPPAAPPTGPIIIEVPAQRQPTQSSDSGGKFGAASSATSGTSR